MSADNITDREFNQFQRFIYDAAGIALSPAKKAMVSGRLVKRLQQYRLDSYAEYVRLPESGDAPSEVQVAVDLLTTHETYFFRESSHFDLLRELTAAVHNGSRGGTPRTQPFRVWSAASSSGEEGYSIAMVLADCMPDTPWEVFGSDISTRVRQVVGRVLAQLKPGGHFFIGHSESLHDITEAVQPLMPSLYRKP